MPSYSYPLVINQWQHGKEAQFAFWMTHSVSVSFRTQGWATRRFVLSTPRPIFIRKRRDNSQKTTSAHAHQPGFQTFPTSDRLYLHTASNQNWSRGKPRAQLHPYHMPACISLRALASVPEPGYEAIIKPATHLQSGARVGVHFCMQSRQTQLATITLFDNSTCT